MVRRFITAERLRATAGPGPRNQGRAEELLARFAAVDLFGVSFPFSANHSTSEYWPRHADIQLTPRSNATQRSPILKSS